jgi:hypothetical protein
MNGLRTERNLVVADAASYVLYFKVMLLGSTNKLMNPSFHPSFQPRFNIPLFHYVSITLSYNSPPPALLHMPPVRDFRNFDYLLS